MKYAVVVIDYYTKWVEVEPLARITEHKVTDFVWKNIIWCFGIPNNIVSDHGTQFDIVKAYLRLLSLKFQLSSL